MPSNFQITNFGGNLSRQKDMIREFRDIDLSSRNTFRMKVSCRRFIEYDSISDLEGLDFSSLDRPVKHIGGGSNLLFTGDFPGTLLHSAIRFIETVNDSGDELTVSAGAGVVFDELCDWAAGHGLWGPENLSHIPGETGAAAVQNIGAYGVEAKDIIKTVHCFDTLSRRFVDFDVADCRYAYRESIFKLNEYKDRYIVTAVDFIFSRNAGPKLEYGNIREAVQRLSEPQNPEQLRPADVRRAIIATRKSKLPEVSETGSAGSFFKNPVVSREIWSAISAASGQPVPHYDVTAPDGNPMVKIPAAWLIEQCGWKGAVMGGAGVCRTQPLVIINASGEATPDEIVTLEKRIRQSVSERFGIELSAEVEHVPEVEHIPRA